jgi:hypothetical protein
MSRRRRPHREIPFSFESFLDVVANVVGIIIRLILVAWIGAKSYKAVVDLPPPPPPPPAMTEPEPLPEPSDPRLGQIARRREELTHEERQALAQRRRDEERIHDEAERLRQQALEIAEKREELEQAQADLTAQTGEKGQAARKILLSVEELQKRSEKLAAELKKAEQRPKETKELRYRSPVAAVVQTEEVMFECHAGRVTLFDRAALEEQVKVAVKSRIKELRDRWELSGSTDGVGAFRVRYVLERQKSMFDGPNNVPSNDGYSGLLSWQGEPVQSIRGESADQALATGSAFRKIVDELDSQQTVVTLWVYPDSFGLYRRLRDYLHGRELVVAGRPLPDGVPITFSHRGSASRGQ